MGETFGKLSGRQDERERGPDDDLGNSKAPPPWIVVSPRRLHRRRRRALRAHVEAAIARAGPFCPARRPLVLRLLGRFLSGVLQTFGAVRRGSTAPCHLTTDWSVPGLGEGVGRTVLFGELGERRERKNLLVVVAPPIGGDETSPNVRALVSAALSAGWRVAVHSRDRGALFDPGSLRECVEAARALAGPGVRTGVVGLSVGAHEACKARLPYPLVSVSNGYDLGEALKHMHPLARRFVARRTCLDADAVRGECPDGLSCVRELLDARAPTLLVNSRNDPLVPDRCLDIGDSIAAGCANVACVTSPSGGHLGFVGRDGKRWAFEIALGFLESAVAEADDHGPR